MSGRFLIWILRLGPRLDQDRLGLSTKQSGTVSAWRALVQTISPPLHCHSMCMYLSTLKTGYYAAQRDTTFEEADKATTGLIFRNVVVYIQCIYGVILYSTFLI